jgi:hypothetical protein
VDFISVLWSVYDYDARGFALAWSVAVGRTASREDWLSRERWPMALGTLIP